MVDEPEERLDRLRRRETEPQDAQDQPLQRAEEWAIAASQPEEKPVHNAALSGLCRRLAVYRPVLQVFGYLVERVQVCQIFEVDLGFEFLFNLIHQRDGRY